MKRDELVELIEEYGHDKYMAGSSGSASERRRYKSDASSGMDKIRAALAEAEQRELALVEALKEISSVLGPNVPKSVTDQGAQWEWRHALKVAMEALAAHRTAAGEVRERCPDCGRLKARNADDAMRGDCDKWYAVRDPEAAAECAKIATQQEKGDE